MGKVAAVTTAVTTAVTQPRQGPAPPVPIAIQEVSSRSTNLSSPSKTVSSPSKNFKKLDPVAMAKKVKQVKNRDNRKLPALPKTGYEFERVWRSLQSDPQAFCSYLQLIKPSSYKKLFKQGIESDLASGIVQTIRERMLAADHAHSLKTLS